MQQLIAITRADGGVSLMRLAPQTVDGRAAPPDVPGEIAKWSDCHRGQYASHREITEDQVPADRTFRDAWTDAGGAVAVDMEKARDIHMGRLRKARDEKLAALDVEYQKALESGSKEDQAAVAAKKQALRDMPAATDLRGITTPEALAAFVPDVLTD